MTSATKPSNAQHMTILADTREQLIPPFPPGVDVHRFTMGEGDYSTPALVRVARIERKSRADFAASITWGRERLDREMVRLQAFPLRAVIVEANATDFGERVDDFGRKGVHPHAVIGAVASYQARYQVPIFFMGNASNAAKLMVGLFRRWEEQRQEQA